MSPSAPILIVGGGLAGSWLACWLHRLGREVLLVDRRLPGAASPVAAGLFHPAPGARWAVRAGFAEEHPFARDCYRALEAVAGCPLWHELPLRRRLDHPPNARRWSQLAGRPELHHWILDKDATGVCFAPSGWVDVPTALAALQAPLRAAGRVRNALVEDVELESVPAGIRWRGQTFAAAVLCRGWREAGARGGRHLSWRNARGELLRVQLAARPEGLIESDSLWRIPLADGRWRCGASYAWRSLPRSPSRAGVHGLLARLARAGFEPRLIEAVAGVRPIQRADRVLAAPVPGTPGLWVFNSLGSHGSLRAPLHAHRLAGVLHAATGG